jgi:hypothetical protein
MWNQVGLQGIDIVQTEVFSFENVEIQGFGLEGPDWARTAGYD